MIHLYALADGATGAAGLAGIDERPVTERSDLPLRAVLSEHPEPPRATTERALAHARVVAAACEGGHALPVRYGAHHADPTALRAALADRADELAGALARVGGHLEVAVRLASPPEPATPTAATPTAATPAAAAATAPGPAAAPGTGRAYLEERLAAERAARAAHADAVARLRHHTRAMEPLAAAVTEHDGPRGPERCLLVPRERVPEALAAAGTADDDVVVAGPWPPYTFA